jgi:3-hydroxybutyryl-CoA dehydrogenase
MKIAVIGGDEMKEELLSQGIKDGVELIWSSGQKEVSDSDASINFETGSISVKNTSIRFNSWPGFLKGELVEIATIHPDEIKKSELIFSCFNKKVEAVADMNGFIGTRIICMIINEAFFALEENISTKEEIDTAMKLGTNYPFGPFEWAEKIGLPKIYQLLTHLAKTDPRYQPAALLEKQALAS